MPHPVRHRDIPPGRAAARASVRTDHDLALLDGDARRRAVRRDERPGRQLGARHGAMVMCCRSGSSLARRRAIDGRWCLDGWPLVGCSAVEGGGAPTPHARHIIVIIVVTIVVTIAVIAIVIIVIAIVVVRPLPHSSCAPATLHLSLLFFVMPPSSFMPVVSSSMSLFFDSVVPFVDAVVPLRFLLRFGVDSRCSGSSRRRWTSTATRGWIGSTAACSTLFVPPATIITDRHKSSH